jgi:hypothetical protein
MSIPCKFERSILRYDEQEVILRSHHPEIYDAGLDDLKALRQRLRDMRDKERTLARTKRREARGKGPPERRELSRLRRASLAAQAGVRRRIETREQGNRSYAETGGTDRAHEAARRALAMRRAAQFAPRPPTEDTPGQGMRAGILAYLITQAGGMAERSSQQAQHERDDLRRVVGFSVADEIEKIDRLRKSGSITDQEFTRLRAKLIQ